MYDLNEPQPPTKESLVAFIHEYHGAVMLTYKGEALASDVEHLSYQMNDFFNDQLPNGVGLWMWEGTAYCCGPYDDPDIRYSGTWRRLTETELKNLASRGDPWWQPPSTQDWFNNLVGSQDE